ncbi:MAG: HlyD family efflux transporter periplasmic adaptor subunit [Betaproteobacteria bacterium]|nr:HlyD family efflux transporter periplasmic adaptor subunit [Betaproteobacteria bacterium]
MATVTASAGAPGAVELLRLQTAVLSQERFARSTAALATALCDQLRCERVTVGWQRRDYIAVIALSHGADFDPRQAIFERIAAAMDEAVEQASTVVLPQPDGAAPQVAMAHLEFAGGGQARAVCTAVLADQAQAIGAITLERASPFNADEIVYCEDAAALCAPILALKRRAERSWFAATSAAMGNTVRGALSSGGTPARLAYGAAALALAALLFVPVTYHVAAPARLEGSIQRAVVAPVDGFLEQVNVRPGDAVAAGQILAELATQDLETERNKRHSELVQHENVYKAALARSDRTQLVINQAKAAESRAQVALIDNQLRRSQLRAPFDGVVIKGDLAPQLGAPVQRGDVLLTLAPDNRFRLIVEVDERDVALLRPGMQGKLALAAAPGDVLGFSVARILPVAVAADGRNYFEVEGMLDPRGRALRPGLRGVAKIAAGQRPAAWIATHRLIAWLRLTAWSLGA